MTASTAPVRLRRHLLPRPRARSGRALLVALLAAGLAAAPGTPGTPGTPPASAATLATGVAPSPGSGAAATSPAAGARRATWSWPVPEPHPVLRPFVAPEHAWSPGHRGLDIGTAVDTVVVAPDDGVVHFSGVVVDRPVLSLRHADGVLSSLEPVTSELRAGDAVERGQPVGVVRAGHCAEGPSCVHLGARVDGAYVSPLLFLGGGVPSVLLPTRR